MVGFFNSIKSLLVNVKIVIHHHVSQFFNFCGIDSAIIIIEVTPKVLMKIQGNIHIYLNIHFYHIQ